MKPIKLMKKVLAVVLCLSLVSISPASGAEGTELNATEQTAAVASQSTEQSAQPDTTAQVPSNTEQASSQQADTSAAVSTEPATQTPSSEAVSTEQASTQSTSTESTTETKPTETTTTEQPSTQTVSTETPSTEPSTEVKPTETVSTESSTESSTEQSTEDSKPETVRFHYTSDAVDVVVTTSDDKALPENAQLVVTPVAITEELQSALDAQAAEKQQAIESASAFDIKFMVDGQEIEPGDTVHVQVTIPQVTAGEDASVYHYIDESSTVTDMGATVAANGAVDFDTNHFSTYVIVNNGSNTVTLTLQHYYMDGTTAKKLYQDDSRILTVGSYVTNYKKAANWGIDKVVSVAANGTETQITDVSNIQITSNATIRVYYSKTGTDSINRMVTGNPTFYDYVVNPVQGNREDPDSSINRSSNYTSSNTNRFTIGTYSQNYDQNSYDAVISGQHVNRYNNAARVTGIIAGLDTNDSSKVLFNPALSAPSVFSSDTVKGKRVITNYSLKFAQSADDYTLDSVYDANGNKVANKGDGFFPLDSLINSPKDQNNNGHNFYFGMRYDVSFTIGDYVGPMNFNFTGDDDLWVLLDGKPVLDIGGIHDAITDSVNLWTKLGMTEGVGATGDAKTQIHRLTVLYMERGAGKSNCNMTYTIPAASLVSVTNETTNVTFDKKDSAGNAVANADFLLTNNADSTKTYTASSDANGVVNFLNVKIGSYTMTETAAPAGFIKSTDTWKVEVTSLNNQVTATITNSDGSELDNNTIVNAKSFDETVATGNKTAKLVDWQNRTYQIDLSGTVTTLNSQSATKNADVILVLDASQMSSDKTDKLIAAAQSFVKNLAAVSPNSNIAIVKFNSSAQTILKFTNVKSKLSQILQKISTISTGSWSRPDYGLQEALAELNTVSDSNDKYTVFITDGMPEDSQSNKDNSLRDTYTTNAITAASSIKSIANSYILSVGVEIGTGLEGDLANKLLKGVSSSGTIDYSATYDSLGNVFESLLHKIIYLPTVSAGVVKDYIDPRFKITDANGGTVSTDANGNEMVQWTVSSMNNWSKSITVKAKDAYVGGNNITTNLDGSGIYAANGSTLLKSYDNPVVNVRINGGLTDYSTTIFLGEVLSGTSGAIAESELQSAYANITSLNFNSDAAYTLKLTDPSGNLIATYDPTTKNWSNPSKTSTDIRDFLENEPLADVSYKLFAEITPDVPDADPRAQSAAQSMKNSDDKLYTATMSGSSSVASPSVVYSSNISIAVIKGKLLITKSISRSAYKKIQGDPIFTFKVTSSNGETYYRTLRFTEDVVRSTSTQITLTAEIKDLAKGAYTISELQTIRFSLSGVAKGSDDNSQFTSNGTTATSTIGGVKDVSIPRTATNFYDLGSAVFTNQKNSESRNLTDTDVVKNTFEVGKTLTQTDKADNPISQ